MKIEWCIWCMTGDKMDPRDIKVLALKWGFRGWQLLLLSLLLSIFITGCVSLLSRSSVTLIAPSQRSTSDLSLCSNPSLGEVLSTWACRCLESCLGPFTAWAPWQASALHACWRPSSWEDHTAPPSWCVYGHVIYLGQNSASKQAVSRQAELLTQDDPNKA